MRKGWKRAVAVVLVISSIGIASSTALSTKLAFAPRGALLRGRQQFQARTLRPKQSSIKMAAADGGQMVENSDICELPDKTVFSGSWLAAALGLQPSTGLAFTIPGSDVVRGPHSVAARLLLQKDPEQSMMLPDSVFLKRVVPSQLPARAATKWIRDTQSYRTEVGFYAHFVETLRKQGVLLPISYKVVSTGLKDLTDMLSQYSVSTPEIITADADKIESVVKKCHFLCIVEDLNPARYRQDMLLGREEMDRTLAAMARFHGVTWQNPELLSAAKEHLFENGAYWSPDKRDAKEVASLPKVWNEWLEQFSAVLGEEICESVGVQRLGSRLRASAEAVSDRLHQSFDSPHQCLIHGDLKTANVLLATDWDAAALQQGDGGVMLIDFQWTGIGLAAQDLAYLFASSAHLDVLQSADQTRALLSRYLELLAVASGGRSASYSMDMLQRDMDLALLEYSRTVFGYQLKGKSPAWVESGSGTLGRCAHNRSFGHLKWLLSKVEATLSSLEAGAL